MEMTAVGENQLRDMQMVMLDMLKCMDRVCGEHGLTYYLACGAMLGAIRHKGFIPWDDDADIIMPRCDYELFMEHASEWLPEEYDLVTCKSDPHYPYAFARLQDRRTTYILSRCFDYVGGVPIDIFPLDGLPDGKFKLMLHSMRFKFYKKLLYYNLINTDKHGTRGLHHTFITLCHKLLSAKRLHSKLDSIQQEYPVSTTFLSDHEVVRRKLNRLPKFVYGEPQRVEFEGVMLNGVADYDAYLFLLYHDYMTPPSNVPPLNYRYMDLKKPYMEYRKEHPELSWK